jgi:hypothetical protein
MSQLFMLEHVQYKLARSGVLTALLMGEGNRKWFICYYGNTESRIMYGAVLEWYWQAKTDVPQENHVSAFNYPQQISHALVWDRTKPSVLIIWEMLAKLEVLLEVTPCQFTRHMVSHLRRTVFSKTPFSTLNSLHLCSYCVGKYTNVDIDGACSSPPSADLPEISMFLFRGLCSCKWRDTITFAGSFVVISLFL